ncbi:uroporphyrinogen-III synthase [Microbacterium flavum]|uniref:Uroporphyrinogen-III synthase n=1 Tax=Microbacterium flavum TaxID=415216 RepID=A0ABS5XW97_9MICO|nr:uroporphyrinogen-III synthase [Microbacterium flavum]MBT8798812.1 uroporphyrinogen-III synthase [Microbacterium flavum]
MTSPAQISSALEGCTIVIAVDRRSGELAAALERHGAHVRHAPALTIVSHIDDDALIARTRELIRTPPEILVVTTGVGFRGWMEAADEAGLIDDVHVALRDAQIVARGPKARGAIQQAGFAADWVAESETSGELGEFLVAEGVTGRRVAVQHHGSGADGLDELFTDHGADVVSLTVYRWGPPPDATAVRRSVVSAAAGEVDAVLFTSAPGAYEWIAEAERADALHDIRARSGKGRLLLAAVGPITAGPLIEAGLEPLIAERGRLGSLVRSVVTHFGGGHAVSLVTTAGRLEVRSAGAVLDGRFIPLSRTGVDVLGTLFEAAGRVVSRPVLQASLPRSGESSHAVEMAVARVREALGVPDLIKTVVKRGYRLDVVDPSDD